MKKHGESLMIAHYYFKDHRLNFTWVFPRFRHDPIPDTGESNIRGCFRSKVQILSERRRYEVDKKFIRAKRNCKNLSFYWDESNREYGHNCWKRATKRRRQWICKKNKKKT